MTSDEIEPMVPVMPNEKTTDDIRADGGVRKRYDSREVEAALVPDIR